MPKRKNAIFLSLFILTLLIISSLFFLLVKDKTFSSLLNLRAALSDVSKSNDSSIFGKYMSDSSASVEGSNLDANLDSLTPLRAVLAEYKTNNVFPKEKLKFDVYDEISEIVKINEVDSTIEVSTLASKGTISNTKGDKIMKFDCGLTPYYFLDNVERLSSCYELKSGVFVDKLMECIKGFNFVAYKCTDLGCKVGIKDCVFYE